MIVVCENSDYDVVVEWDFCSASRDVGRDGQSDDDVVDGDFAAAPNGDVVFDWAARPDDADALHGPRHCDLRSVGSVGWCLKVVSDAADARD